MINSNKINEEARRLKIALDQVDIFLYNSTIIAKAWEIQDAFVFLREACDITDRLIKETEEKYK